MWNLNILFSYEDEDISKFCISVLVSQKVLICIYDGFIIHCCPLNLIDSPFLRILWQLCLIKSFYENVLKIKETVHIRWYSGFFSSTFFEKSLTKATRRSNLDKRTSHRTNWYMVIELLIIEKTATVREIQGNHMHGPIFEELGWEQ